MKTRGVKFSTSPVKKYSDCGCEWANEGMCCDRNSLFVFINKDKADMEALVDSGKLLANDMQKFTAWYSNNFGTGYKILKERVDKLTTLSSEDKQKVIGELDKINNTYFNDLHSTKEWLRLNADDVITGQRVCLDAIAKLRSGSMCYTCSSRASVFFNKGRLQLNELQCRATTSTCSKTLDRCP